MKVHDIETRHGVVCAYYDRHQQAWAAYFDDIHVDDGVCYGMCKEEAVENLIDQLMKN